MGCHSWITWIKNEHLKESREGGGVEKERTVLVRFFILSGSNAGISGKKIGKSEHLKRKKVKIAFFVGEMAKISHNPLVMKESQPYTGLCIYGCV